MLHKGIFYKKQCRKCLKGNLPRPCFVFKQRVNANINMTCLWYILTVLSNNFYLQLIVREKTSCEQQLCLYFCLQKGTCYYVPLGQILKSTGTNKKIIGNYDLYYAEIIWKSGIHFIGRLVSAKFFSTYVAFDLFLYPGGIERVQWNEVG